MVAVEEEVKVKSVEVKKNDMNTFSVVVIVTVIITAQPLLLRHHYRRVTFAHNQQS